MQRLSGLDAALLALETPSQHLHVGSCAVLDPSTARRFDLDALAEVVAGRLHLVPVLRRRVMEVPFGVQRPVWVDDPDFELRHHLHEVDMVGGRRTGDLAAFVAQVLARPLDRARPLWEMHLVRGLEDGRAAVVTKIHHAAVDGVAGVDVAAALTDPTPEVSPVPPPEEAWAPGPLPTGPDLLAEAAAELAEQPTQAATQLVRTVQTALALGRRNRDLGHPPPPSPFTAPRTSLNRAVTPARSAALASLPFDEVREIAAATGCTVNDVVLATCAGALLRWLDGRGEHPNGPLVAHVPASVRSEVAHDGAGNVVVPMLVSLATDVADPLARVVAIARSAADAKAQQQLIGPDLLDGLAGVTPPAAVAAAAQLCSATAVADRAPPPFNVSVSNVAGPPAPVYAAGARVVAHHPFGPVVEGCGLNVTVMSYAGSMDYGLVACPDLVNDVGEVAGLLGEAHRELLEASRSG